MSHQLAEILIVYGVGGLYFAWGVWKLWHTPSLEMKRRRVQIGLRGMIPIIIPTYLGFVTAVFTGSSASAVYVFEHSSLLGVPLGVWLMITRWPAFMVVPCLRRPVRRGNVSDPSGVEMHENAFEGREDPHYWDTPY